jgi:hypothetical protein
MTPEDLMQIQGVGEKTVERIRRVVTDYFERDQTGAAPGGPEAPKHVGKGEPTKPAGTAEMPGSEAADSSAEAGESAAAEEAGVGAETAGPEMVEEHTPAEEKDESASPEEGKTQTSE